MNLDRQTLANRGRQQAQTKPSQQSAPATSPIMPSPPTLRSSEVKLANQEQKSIYLPYGAAYAEKHGFKLVDSMAAALSARRAGQKVLTYREADIAARGAYPLGNVAIFNSMVLLDTSLEENDYADIDLLTEDAPQPVRGQIPDTIFEQRKLFNRGIKYKQDGRYATATEEQRAKADQAMAELVRRMTLNKLPPWPEELERGFPLELTKPEFQTFEQYENSVARFNKFYDEWKAGTQCPQTSK